MDLAIFQAALAERNGGPKAAAPAPAAQPAAKSQPASPVPRTSQIAPLMPPRPLKVSGGGMVAPESRESSNPALDQAMERDPISGKLRGLEPTREQSEADAIARNTPPATPEEYTAAPRNPNHPQLNAKEDAGLRAWSHSAGLGDPQYREVNEALSYSAYLAGAGVDVKKLSAIEGKALRAEWGEHYEARLAQAKSVAREIELQQPEMKHVFNNTPFGALRAVVRVLWEISEQRARQK